MAVFESATLEGSARADPEVVIREARRRQRRRRLVVSGAFVVVIGAAAGAAATLPSSPRQPAHHPTVTAPATAPTALPTPPPATGPQPENPGSLALAPNGGLYIADETKNEILERTADGAFHVVAGTGTAGFSGDGGPATKAEIDRPQGMAVAPNGTLYFADSGNRRVRAVSPTGRITTVAGDGQGGAWVAGGTPALDAALLNAASVALSPSGDLYISTGVQVLALQPNGTLTNFLGSQGPYQGVHGVGGPADEASADGADGIAFDSAGDLFVFGFYTKSILMVTPNGTLHLVPGAIYPRGDGSGLVSTPGGAVLAATTTSIVRLTPLGRQTVISFQTSPTPPKDTFLGVRVFAPAGLAVAPNGTMYVDTEKNDGWSDQTVIADISPNGQGALLWRRGPLPPAGPPSHE